MQAVILSSNTTYKETDAEKKCGVYTLHCERWMHPDMSIIITVDQVKHF